jgi:hypothetical protein
VVDPPRLATSSRARELLADAPFADCRGNDEDADADTFLVGTSLLVISKGPVVS